jgi:DNA-binding HxlR family transcriptional regulator
MFATNSVVRPVLEPCGQPDHEDCGLQTVLERLGERWTVMTIAELVQGPKRFRQLERALDDISQRMLTLTVRRLERDGLISRTVEPTIPPAVTYELTERGRSFAELVGGLVEWSRSNRELIARSQRDFDTRRRR